MLKATYVGLKDWVIPSSF